MESAALALAYVVPAVPIWATYTIGRLRTHAKHRAIRAEAQEAGLTEPPSLHPIIDPDLCIGCGACALACHEGDVLGMINGKAELIDPTRCIGHSACQAACPAGGISLVFGTATRGVDIPVVAPDFSSAEPGIYIAGELGGMGLIRNAVEQGRQAMQSVVTAKRQDEANGAGDLPLDMVDVLVVGAGPAGISASLAALEAGLNYVTIEQESLGGTVAHYPRGKIAMTSPVKLPLYGTMKIREISKEQLIELWTGVIEKTGLKITYGERVVDIVPHGPGYSVNTNNTTYLARRVVLAIGRRGSPRKLDVPGEERSKVVYRLVDAGQYKGRNVLVVGGGDSALEAAMSLAGEPGTKVTLAYRRSTFDRARKKNRERLDQLVADGNIDLRLGTEVVNIDEHRVILDVGGKHQSIANDDVIVCAGGVLPTSFLEAAGVAVERKFGTA